MKPAQDPAAPSNPMAAASSWTHRLSLVRHDLRNPLSEILGFSEILQEEAAGHGLHQMAPGFAAIHQSASRIFAEVNHWLNPETLQLRLDSFQELERTIAALSQRIISTAETLSEKCDDLANNSVGDDLLRITSAARRLRDAAPSMLQNLAASFQAEPNSESPGSQYDPHLPPAGEPPTPSIIASGSLLIVDDNEANRALLARRLRRQGYTVSLAENGRQALEKLRARRFDLVLLDVIMPEMNGYQVLEKMKMDQDLRHIPVIMISALDDLEMLARCIQTGAEDYLSKPFDPVLLGARIGSSLEKKRLHDQEQRTYQALLESQKHLAAELAEAAAYVQSLLPAFLTGAVEANWRFIPCSQLGGDAFGYQWLDSDHFAVYLLDVCSHGVGAALLSISVMNVLRSQTLSGVDLRNPGDVLAALNQMFPMDRQHELYFTMWYGVFNKTNRQLAYATAGHPPAVLLTGPDRASARRENLKASGPPIGTFPDSQFATLQTALQAFNRLFVFSDGAYEIARPDGSMLSLDEFVQHLIDRTRAGIDDSQSTLEFLESIRGSSSYEDDLAILQLGFA